MTNTAEFEAQLLLEKVNVLQKLHEISNTLLNDVTYIDKMLCISYYNQITKLIDSLGHEYENVRERGKQNRSA